MGAGGVRAAAGRAPGGARVARLCLLAARLHARGRRPSRAQPLPRARGGGRDPRPGGRRHPLRLASWPDQPLPRRGARAAQAAAPARRRLPDRRGRAARRGARDRGPRRRQGRGRAAGRRPCATHPREPAPPVVPRLGGGLGVVVGGPAGGPATLGGGRDGKSTRTCARRGLECSSAPSVQPRTPCHRARWLAPSP